MATTKTTSELKDGTHPYRPVTHFTMNLCPSRCQESQLVYSEQYKRDNVFVICYFHRLRYEH